MEKKTYIRPEVNICTVEAQSAILTLSTTDKSASNKYDTLVNENDGEYTDIWGN